MNLTREERSILKGDLGQGIKKAMEIIVALGEVYGAEDLVPIESAQISGVSYKNIGQHGLDFLKEWRTAGAKTRVRAFMNPCGMDLEKWRELGIRESFASRQLEVVKTLEELGVEPVLSCTPYYAVSGIGLGSHLAWGESSAVAYVNSVIGARTNREGGPGALAAAVAGRTPRTGLHLDEQRKATLLVHVSAVLESQVDWGVLGYTAGKKAGTGIPCFQGLDTYFKPGAKADIAHQKQCLRDMGSAMAASGAVALFHVQGVTPEAAHKNMLSEKHETIEITNLESSYEELGFNQPAPAASSVDLVAIGCPHLSLEELWQIAQFLDNRRTRIPLWLMTSRFVKQQAQKLPFWKVIEKSGATVVQDTCVVVSPLNELGLSSVLLDSVKATCYVPSIHHGIRCYIDSRSRCLETATTGASL